MTHITGKLLPLVLVLVAAVITPLLLSENAAAQDVDTHPSDLFEPPQEGIETASARDINMNRDLSYLLEEPQDGTEFALPRSSSRQKAGGTIRTSPLGLVSRVRVTSSLITQRTSSLIPFLP